MSKRIRFEPSKEEACITIDKGLYEFYKEYFDKIVSFDKNNREIDK